MKRKTQNEVSPVPEDELHQLDDMSLPTEAPLLTEEAAEAVSRARRLLEPVETAGSAEEKDGEGAAPVPMPWPPMRPDEKPS
jgi:hypothetical protein